VPLKPIRFITENGHTYADTDSVANVLIAGTYQGFRISTTHLNVTAKGESTPAQLANAAKLIKAARHEASKTGGLLLTGDFNAPRGRPTFSLINEAFEDGVPAHYTTSIDGSLHRAGHIPLMVDGLFHTPNYQLKNATLHTGVSDHCALTCTLTQA
jgi:endonuclease/exonuclease/phosphatase family metal-dependent hydrolase